MEYSEFNSEYTTSELNLRLSFWAMSSGNGYNDLNNISTIQGLPILNKKTY